MPHLSLYLLGPPRIEREGTPIQVDTRKAIALLAYLAITGEPHRRDALVNLLWPEADQQRGRAALRRTLSVLRKALAHSVLDVDRESIGLISGKELWLDVDAFRALLSGCAQHGHAESEVCPSCIPLLTDAIGLYRADFMSGFTLRDSVNFDDWQFFQTDDLRQVLMYALRKLVAAHAAQGALDTALRYARRWLAIDRLSEEAHVRLMELYAWQGQRSAALQQYEACRRTLDSQLGVQPEPSTTTLYHAILEGRVPAPPVAPRHPQADPTFVTAPQLFVMPETPAAWAQGEVRIVTVLLADLRGALRQLSNRSPEDEAALTARLLGILSMVLPKYGGHLQRRLGGAVLSAFEPRESAAEMAIRAALEMREMASQAGLSPCFGISTGEAILSRVPVEGGGSFDLIGSVVDQAVGLARQASAGQILIDGSTYRLAYRAAAFSLHPAHLDGTGGHASVYLVEGLLSPSQPVGKLGGLYAELVGRERERAQLQGTLERVLQGRGQMVSLIGEAGVGKSRLIAELRQVALVLDADGTVPLWLEGRCLELGTAPSYAPFLDILRTYLAWGARETERRRRERIASTLEDLVAYGSIGAARAEETGALLARLFTIHWSDEWTDRLEQTDTEQIRRDTYLALRDLIVALTHRQPVVLVLEDLHWADDLSLDLISLLMDCLPHSPLLLVCAYRPEREHRCRHLGTIAAQKCGEAYTELYLRELTGGQGRQLLSSLLGVEPLPATLVDAVLESAQGNPFFIEEIVRSLIDAGIVYAEADRWRVRESVLTLSVPESVQNVLLSRLDHLTEELQHVLQVASVIGRVFERRVLARAIDTEVALDRALWELEDRALIYQERTIPEVEYSFKHVLTQETVYRSIVRQRREAMHRRVAAAIETLYGEGLVEHYEELAYHYERAGDVLQATAYLLQAGEKAKRNHANEAAIAQLTRALGLLKNAPEAPERAKRELDLLVALGVPLVLERGHAHPEVGHVYGRAQELCAGGGTLSQRFQIAMGLRRYHLLRGELLAALEYAEQLLALAEGEGDPAYVARAHMMYGEVLYHLGRLADARAQYVRGYEQVDRVRHRSDAHLFGNDTGIACRIFGALGAWYLGYPDRALQEAEDAIAMAEELEHPFTCCVAMFFTALICRLRREPDAVARLADEALQTANQHGFPLYEAWGTMLAGWALSQTGHVEDGITQLRQGSAALRDMGAAVTMSDGLAALAEVYTQIGWTTVALEVLEEALAAADQRQHRLWEAELHRLRGELLRREGALGDAEAAFQRAIHVAQEQGARGWELRATTSLARLWHAQDRDAEARAALGDIVGWFSEGFETADYREASALLTALA
jgi:DNA-binding SARP family transcriptional activator/predicted ATPase/class 3 adenylate cyclase